MHAVHSAHVARLGRERSAGEKDQTAKPEAANRRSCLSHSEKYPRRYAIERRIGEGGLAAAYVARDVRHIGIGPRSNRALWLRVVARRMFSLLTSDTRIDVRQSHLRLLAFVCSISGQGGPIRPARDGVLRFSIRSTRVHLPQRLRQR